MKSSKSRVIVDTGFLVALFDRSDKYHQAAVQWLKKFEGTLISVPHVLAETGFFIGSDNTAKLADQIGRGWIVLHSPDPDAYFRIATLLRKYKDLDPDLTDVALVWLAEATQINSIVTVDVTDFSTYRINGKSKFELLPWQSVE